jgi:hypothetical protein
MYEGEVASNATANAEHHAILGDHGHGEALRVDLRGSEAELSAVVQIQRKGSRAGACYCEESEATKQSLSNRDCFVEFILSEVEGLAMTPSPPLYRPIVFGTRYAAWQWVPSPRKGEGQDEGEEIAE